MNLPAEIEKIEQQLQGLKAACHEQQMRVNLAEQAFARERQTYSDLLTQWQIVEAQLAYLRRLQAENADSVARSEGSEHTTPT